jgi:hypothetical protein
MNILHLRDDRDTTVVTSNDAHVDATLTAVNRVIEQPLGCGAGCAGPASYYDDQPADISENYYLQIAEEYGLAGLIVWLAALLFILNGLRKQSNRLAQLWLAAGLGYLAIGLLLHVFADEPLVIVWFSVAGLLVGLSHKNARFPNYYKNRNMKKFRKMVHKAFVREKVIAPKR